MLSITPVLPSQYIAPPSSPAVLFLNIKSFMCTLSALTYTAPPSPETYEFVKVELSIVE